MGDPIKLTAGKQGYTEVVGEAHQPCPGDFVRLDLEFNGPAGFEGWRLAGMRGSQAASSEPREGDEYVCSKGPADPVQIDIYAPKGTTFGNSANYRLVEFNSKGELGQVYDAKLTEPRSLGERVVNSLGLQWLLGGR
jgi:hypothetical protein